MELFLFYIFSTGILISSLSTILTSNPVFSIFFLVLTFVNASGLLLLVEIEFFAMLFLIVYVGAIAVLFLFVIMILDLKIVSSNKKENPFKIVPIGFFIGFLFLFEIIYIFGFDFQAVNSHALFKNFYFIDWVFYIDYNNSLNLFGQTLYTYFVYYFLTVGIILLLAIISTIGLTSNYNPKQDKRQLIFQQLSRSPKAAVFNIKLK